MRNECNLYDENRLFSRLVVYMQRHNNITSHPHYRATHSSGVRMEAFGVVWINENELLLVSRGSSYTLIDGFVRVNFHDRNWCGYWKSAQEELFPCRYRTRGMRNEQLALKVIMRWRSTKRRKVIPCYAPSRQNIIIMRPISIWRRALIALNEGTRFDERKWHNVFVDNTFIFLPCYRSMPSASSHELVRVVN